MLLEMLMFLVGLVLLEVGDEPVPDHDGPGWRGSGVVCRMSVGSILDLDADHVRSHVGQW